jgi:hypothetical protein
MKGKLIGLVVCILLLASIIPLSVSSNETSNRTIYVNDDVTLHDPEGDVLTFDPETGDYYLTDEKPNVDLKQLSYLKPSGSSKAVFRLEVFGEIENRGNLEDDIGLLSNSSEKSMTFMS